MRLLPNRTKRNTTTSRVGPLHVTGLLLLGMAGCAGPEPRPEQAQARPQQAQPAPATPPANAPVGDAERPGGPPNGPIAQQAGNKPGQAGGEGGALLDQIASELNLQDQQRRALAQHYFTTGMRFYEGFDYRKAAENFKQAADADPNNATIRQYLLQAQLLAGDRVPEFETVAEQLRRQREVSIELERNELKRIFGEGKQLFENKEYSRAMTRFEQVLEKIRWFPYKVDMEGMEGDARRFIVQARREQREKELLEADARERRAQEEANQEQEKHRRERQEQVQLLLRRVLDQLALKQFDKADATIDEIFLKDPGNEEGLKLRAEITNARHINKENEIYYRGQHELEQAQIGFRELEVPELPHVVEFPDREKWETIRRRQTGIQQDDETREPDWIRDYKAVLKSRKVTLNFPETPFSEVVSFLQDITGLNITVSPGVDQEKTVSLRLKDIPLEDALKIILEQTGYAMTFANDTLMITKPEEARGQYHLEIYDVQDLLSQIPDFPGDKIEVSQGSGGGGGGGGGKGGGGTFSFDEGEEGKGTVLDPDKLQEIITNSVGEDKWDEPAAIEIHRGQAIITQTRELHASVREVLKNLRRNTGLFVQIEARFINMTDDFLRDIGVDFRDLANSPTPNFPTFGQTPPLQLDPGVGVQPIRGGSGHDLIGFGRQIPAQGNPRAGRLGPVVGVPPGQTTLFGSSMFGGRTENVLDGGNGYFTGLRLNDASVSGSNAHKGLNFMATMLDPFQLNAIVRAEEETAKRKIVQAPVITASNRQRVHVSVITQRAYISDYELSSGGTGQVVAEVADPIIETFQEGIVLDVRPTISSDRKYITLDVRPTLATLVGGTFQQIQVNLGTVSNAAINVNIEVPRIQLQEAFTTVTLPDGGTALLGGFRQVNEKEEHVGVPIVDHVPFLNKLFSRDGELNETSSLLVLVTARMVSLRDEEARRFNSDDR